MVGETNGVEMRFLRERYQLSRWIEAVGGA
jgi:hypothetical protein